MAGWCLSLTSLLSLHPALTRAWLLSANQLNQFHPSLTWIWLLWQPRGIWGDVRWRGRFWGAANILCRQACSSHNSTWLWDECGDPLRAAAGKVTASKYIFEVTNFLENYCQPSCICVKQSVIFVFSQTSLKPPQKHWWSSLTISDCSFRWNWKYFLRIWWSDLSFSQFCIYFPGDLIRFAGRELLVSEMIFLMFFPPTSCSKTNRNFNCRLFLLKNWNNHALTMHSTMNLFIIWPIYFDMRATWASEEKAD